ncbi:MAG: glycosyltransferase family 9 protein [Ignavibacterium sp.]|jgi:heptosyltransferase-2|nr:glycosyltransferase family 9 protein [Ignavibacterium sp.]
MTEKQKILFIQTAFPGDAILTLPALQILKQSNPDCLIDVLCIPNTKEIFESSESVDNVIVLDKKGKHKSIFKTLKFSDELSKNNYCRVYSAHRSFRTALIVLNLRVKDSFGFDNSSLMHVYKNLVPYHLSKHEVQRNLDLIGYKYDNVNWKIKPIVKTTAEKKEKVREFILSNELSSGFIAVAPASIWNTKMYPAESYIKIINYLIDKENKVVLIGSKDEHEYLQTISDKCSKNVVNAAGKFSIVESIELIKSAKLLISNDSAPTHMGMAAGIKTLTIYCSTIPGFGFYPYSENSDYLSYDDLKCKPCGIHGYKKCPIKTFDCGKKLKPDLIIKKIEEMLIGRH